MASEDSIDNDVFGSFASNPSSADDVDADSAEVTYDNNTRSPEDWPDLPLLPEQESSSVDWSTIREGISTLGLAAEVAAGLYQKITVAVTGKDPFAGIKLNLPTGGKKSSEDDALARVRKAAAQ